MNDLICEIIRLIIEWSSQFGRLLSFAKDNCNLTKSISMELQISNLEVFI